MRCHHFLSLAILGLLLVSPVRAADKPSPPPDLMKIFILFMHGEDHVEGNDWGEASRWIDNLDKRYRAIKPHLDRAVEARKVVKFEKVLTEFEDAVHARNHDLAHEMFIALNRGFVEFLNDFSYQIPPALRLVQNDLKEATVAAKKHDASELADELREVGIYFGQALPQLKTLGVSSRQIDEFRALIAKAESRCVGRDWPAVLPLLDESKRLLGTICKEVGND